MGLLFCLFFTFPLAAQESSTSSVYYEKVPKLIPQADGSYRVADGEFYFVPVTKQGSANPVKSLDELPSQQEAPITQQVGTIVVEKKQNLPGKLPYIGIGISYMRSEAELSEGITAIKDSKPAAKIAFGGRLSPYIRLEAFYQYRSEIRDTWYRIISVKAKMQDLGANLFVYANPQDKTRFFAGAGIATTRVQPTAKIAGVDINDIGEQLSSDPQTLLFPSKWCVTPSIFAGVEIPVSAQTDMDITAFYSHTNIHKDDLRHIASYGLALNLRFNLPEKTITYVK